MTTTEKLKEYIEQNYNSLREFTIAIDMPYTTLHSILRRGVENSSVSNIAKICDALNISLTDLLTMKLNLVVHNLKTIKTVLWKLKKLYRVSVRLSWELQK